MHDKEHRDLLLKVASGDESALGDLYDAHAQVLYNHAVRILRSADDAAEAVSDLILSVWSGAASPRDILTPAEAVLASRMREVLLVKTAGRRNVVREVDLWALVSGTEIRPRHPAADAARDALGMCGAVSTTVLSLVYFGGWSIPDVAERFSMTPAECRSRLHGCLATLSARLSGSTPGKAHGGRLSVCSAARSLGALPRGEDPEYDAHLDSGCSDCRSEVSRYAAAVSVLPRLLPDVALPPELLEKILFSIRLARLAAPASDPAPEQPRTRAAETRPPENDDAAAGVAASGSGRRRPGRAALALSAAGVLGAALYLGFRLLAAQIELEEKTAIIESMQERHTELILKYDRLAGISGFFESKGVVTVLNGTADYPGLAGKIVWDTGGKSAMLQILDPPGDLADARIRVKALAGNAAVRLAEFRSDERDRGNALYRFFPVDVAPGFAAEGFTVDVADAGLYRSLMVGMIPNAR